MGVDVLTGWDRSPFAVVDRVDPRLLGSEGPVRFLLVRGAREGLSLGVVGAIWVSEDGSRGGVISHPEGSWSAAELTRNHQSAVERGWSPARIFEYWRDAEAWGLEIEPPEAAESLRSLFARVDVA